MSKKEAVADLVMLVLAAKDIDPSEVKAGRFFANSPDELYEGCLVAETALALLNVQFQVPTFTDDLVDAMEVEKARIEAEVDAVQDLLKPSW